MRIENGDLGEEGFELRNVLGLLVVVVVDEDLGVLLVVRQWSLLLGLIKKLSLSEEVRC